MAKVFPNAAEQGTFEDYTQGQMEDMHAMWENFHWPGIYEPEVPGSLWLPPKRFQRKPRSPLETPVDERGLVKIPDLLDMVLQTVDPEYEWPMQFLSTHHFYWPSSWYEHRPRSSVNPAEFRDLAIHKGKLPRVFENWLHIVTYPPPVPADEVMHYRVESWKVAVNLFNSARDVIWWEKRFLNRRVDKNGTDDEYAQQILQDIIDRRFEGVEQYMEALASVPPEFRLVEPSDSPRELAATIGSLVIPRAIHLGNPIEALRRPSLAMLA